MLLKDTIIRGKTLKKNKEIINTKFRMIVTSEVERKGLACEKGTQSTYNDNVLSLKFFGEYKCALCL